MDAIIQTLKEHDQFIITSHEHPDPDSLGSMIGLYFGMRQLGKTCRMVCSDPPPANLRWPGLELVEVLPKLEVSDNQWIIVLDCEPERTGALAETILSSKKIINIDHHQGNKYRGPLTYVASNEAATSVIVYRILKELGVSLDKNIATALYAGIVGDTGGFRYTNTSAETFIIAAELMEHDIPHADIARQIFASQPMEFMRFLGHVLTNLKSDLDGRLVWLEVSYDDFVRFGAEPSSSDQLIQYARMVDTSRIALLFRETKPGEVRIGFRSDSLDVGRLATQLGGGGHRLAAGAKMTGSLDTVVDTVLNAAREYLNKEEQQ